MNISHFINALPSGLRRGLLTAATGAVAIGLGLPSSSSFAATGEAKTPTTIVLLHGAMADSSSWNGVIPKLQAHGYTVIAAANPLRGLKSDSDYVSALLTSVKGPVVLVGHSYAGSVISNAAVGHDNVKALVYVAAFAPEAGESAFDLVGKNPGSILGAALAAPVDLGGTGKDFYVDQGKFQAAFAADLPAAQAKLMAATLRPVTEAALKEPSGAPAWKSIPSWFVYGSADKSIPAATHAFMASRAGARKPVVVDGASHVVMLSQPAAVAQVIDNAVTASVK
jgi:pimeloyl-ACP methyl ester carboxylesterase